MPRLCRATAVQPPSPPVVFSWFAVSAGSIGCECVVLDEEGAAKTGAALSGSHSDSAAESTSSESGLGDVAMETSLMRAWTSAGSIGCECVVLDEEGAARTGAALTGSHSGLGDVAMETEAEETMGPIVRPPSPVFVVTTVGRDTSPDED